VLDAILFCAASVRDCNLLIWHVALCRYIQTWRVLDEASRLVVEAPCDDVAKERFGALVHVSCNLEVGGHPAIDSLGVVAKGAAVLVREGEMYQWEENVKEYEREDHSGHRKTVKEYSYYRVSLACCTAPSLRSFRRLSVCYGSHRLIECVFVELFGYVFL
jgi:hypothetical protein